MISIRPIRPFVSFVMLLILGAALAARGAEPAELVAPPPETFRAYDQPNDDGSKTAIEWAASPSEGEGVYYIVEIAQSPDDFAAGNAKRVKLPSTGNWKSDRPEDFGFSKKNDRIHYVGLIPARFFPPPPRKISPPRQDDTRDQERFAYEMRLENERLRYERRRICAQTFHYRLGICTEGGTPVYIQEDGAPRIITARARPNGFRWSKLNNLIFAIAFCGIVLAFIRAARANPNLFIRRIAGLEAVDEAIGRATEMGRSVLFVHGLEGMGNLATIAAINILARVARRAADFDARVLVANCDAIVMAVSQEVVRQAYTEAGRPDAFQPDDVSLVGSEQFTYVAAVGGIMVRQRPAAIFLLGSFAAESLLLAETGASTGAIQIAGTDAYTQLPFLITSCDYTLMGEELYAASAYLTREPLLLGSLRGQDVGKGFLMAVFVLGTALATCGWHTIAQLLKAF